MKKITLKAASLIISAICLCGCENKQSKGYVDTSEFIESIENSGDIEKSDYFGGYRFDDRAYNTMSSGFSANGKYLYYLQMKNLRIDGENGEVEVVCHKAGCAHSAGSPDCSAYQLMRSPLTSPDGIYYCSENKLCLYDGKTDKVLLRNNFCTEYEEEVPSTISTSWYTAADCCILWARRIILHITRQAAKRASLSPFPTAA